MRLRLRLRLMARSTTVRSLMGLGLRITVLRPVLLCGRLRKIPVLLVVMIRLICGRVIILGTVRLKVCCRCLTIWLHRVILLNLCWLSSLLTCLRR